MGLEICDLDFIKSSYVSCVLNDQTDHMTFRFPF